MAKKKQRKIDSSVIEEKAVVYFKDVCLNSLLIKPEIYSNDKTPVWDGDLYLYNKSPFSNNTFVGRAPIQLKGTTNDKNKFNISNEKLNHFYNDGGVIFILIYINPNNFNEKKLYYKLLLPYNIMFIVQQNKSNGQDSSSLTFKEFKSDPRAFADIVLTFIQESKVQSGGNVRINAFNDAISDTNTFKALSFSTYAISKDDFNPLQKITEEGAYIKAIPYSDLISPVTVSFADKIMLSTDRTIDIRVNGELFYENIKEIWREGKQYFQFSDSLTFTIKKYDRDDFEENRETLLDFTYNIQLKGNYSEFFKSYKFLKYLVDKASITINGTEMNGKFNITEENIKGIKFNYEYHDRIIKCLNYLGIDDLDITGFVFKGGGIIDLIGLDELEFNRIRFTEEEKIDKPRYKFNIFQMGDKKIFSILELDYENDKVTLLNFDDFFNTDFVIFYDKYEENTIGKYLLAYPHILTCDNVGTSLIIENVKESYSNNEEPHIITALLNFIIAFDEKPRDEVEKLIVYTSKLLFEKNPNETNKLNYYQVKYRLKTLDELDKKELENIYINSNKIINKAGAAILLNKEKESKNLINQLELKDMEAFETYPIYRLLVINNSYKL